jgi:uncharacterized protein YndB with AHSA1/START domain
MASQQFNLVSEWRLAAPVDRVWAELMRPDDWPQWWRAVKRVETLAEGGARGVGAVRRLTWGSALPYELTFEMRATRVEPMTVIEGRASGELDGTGRWTLTPDGNGTLVRYDWQIEVTKPWMRTLAPLLRPAFAWNHNVVMGWGYDGLRRRLGLEQ